MGFIARGEPPGTAAKMYRRIYWDTALAASDPWWRSSNESGLGFLQAGGMLLWRGWAKRLAVSFSQWHSPHLQSLSLPLRPRSQLAN